MLIAILLAIIFVPLLFIMGIRTGIEQSDNKWLKITKENSSGNQLIVERLQAKLKSKNEEILNLKESIEQLNQTLDISKLAQEEKENMENE